MKVNVLKYKCESVCIHIVYDIDCSVYCSYFHVCTCFYLFLLSSCTPTVSKAINKISCQNLLYLKKWKSCGFNVDAPCHWGTHWFFENQNQSTGTL